MSQPHFPEYTPALEPAPHTHTIGYKYCMHSPDKCRASVSQILKPPLIRLMGGGVVGGVVLTTMVKRELEDCEIGRQGDRGTLGAQW